MLFTIALLSLAGLLAARAPCQSLGDVARQQRKSKPPATAKVYTNDNLPTSGGITALASGPAPDSASSPAADSAKPKTEAKSEDKSKLEAEWKARLEGERERISKLVRDTDDALEDVAQRLASYVRGSVYDKNPIANQHILDAASGLGEQLRALSEAQRSLAEMGQDLRGAGLQSSSPEFQKLSEMQAALAEERSKVEVFIEHLRKGEVVVFR